ncbi:MAG: RNA-binding protein [Polyangiaceae bacterium]
MGSRLYVGNLSYSTTEESLRTAFTPYGQVTSASIMLDRMSGRSRGFGFIEFSSDAEAQKAIEALNGAELDGRSLTVNEARAREEGSRRGGNGPRGHRGPPTDRSWDTAPRDGGGRDFGGGRKRNDRDRRRSDDSDW